MAVSKRVKELVKDTIDYGMNSGLPEFMLFIVYARARRGNQNGWAIIGATSKTQARQFARSEGWLETAVITGVETFESYCVPFGNTDEVYKELKSDKKLPKEIGQWFELEWGY